MLVFDSTTRVHHWLFGKSRWSDMAITVYYQTLILQTLNLRYK
jgi:hypothetical protein